MSRNWPPDQRSTAEATVKKFNVQWTERNSLANALVEYSASLTALAQAGKNGKESAAAVAKSFAKLCDAIDVALPPVKVVDSVVKVGSSLYGRFAMDFAARTLGEGMQNIQPAIDETARVLADSLVELETGFDAIRDQVLDETERQTIDDVKVSTWRAQSKRLVERRAGLILNLLEAAEARDRARAALLQSDSPAEMIAQREKELARVSELHAAIAAELTLIDETLAFQAARLEPVDARKVADLSRLAEHIKLVRLVRAGLSDWAAAHGRLAASAAERRPLQVADLMQTALEIKELVDATRNQPTQ